MRELDISYQNRHITGPFVNQYNCHDYRESKKCECETNADFLTETPFNMNLISPIHAKPTDVYTSNMQEKSCDQPIEMITILPPF